MSEQGSSGEPPGEAAAAGRARVRQARDKNLVEAARAGDDTAFGKLYDEWVDHVYDRAANAGASAAEAREITEATFVAAYRDLAKLKQPAAFGAKILQVTRRETAARVPTATRPTTPPPTKGSPAEDRLSRATNADAVAADHDVAAVLRQAASVLDDRTREILDLHFRQGLTRNETAAVIGDQPDKVGETVAKLPPAMAVLTRARVLWRSGAPEDPALAEELVKGGVTDFDAAAVRTINRFAKDNDRARARSLIGIAPVELYAAIPLADAPAGLKMAVASTLVTEGVPMDGSAFVKRDDKGAILDQPKRVSKTRDVGAERPTGDADARSIRPGIDAARPVIDKKKAAAVASAALAAELASDQKSAAAAEAAAKHDDKPRSRKERKARAEEDKAAEKLQSDQVATARTDAATRGTDAGAKPGSTTKIAGAGTTAPATAPDRAAAAGRAPREPETATDALPERRHEPAAGEVVAGGAAVVGAAGAVAAVNQSPDRSEPSDGSDVSESDDGEPTGPKAKVTDTAGKARGGASSDDPKGADRVADPVDGEASAATAEPRGEKGATRGAKAAGAVAAGLAASAMVGSDARADTVSDADATGPNAAATGSDEASVGDATPAGTKTDATGSNAEAASSDRASSGDDTSTATAAGAAAAGAGAKGAADLKGVKDTKTPAGTKDATRVTPATDAKVAKTRTADGGSKTKAAAGVAGATAAAGVAAAATTRPIRPATGSPDDGDGASGAMKWIAAAVVIVVLLGLGVFALTRGDDKKDTAVNTGPDRTTTTTTRPGSTTTTRPGSTTTSSTPSSSTTASTEVTTTVAAPVTPTTGGGGPVVPPPDTPTTPPPTAPPTTRQNVTLTGSISLTETTIKTPFYLDNAPRLGWSTGGSGSYTVRVTFRPPGATEDTLLSSELNGANLVVCPGEQGPDPLHPDRQQCTVAKRGYVQYKITIHPADDSGDFERSASLLVN